MMGELKDLKQPTRGREGGVARQLLRLLWPAFLVAGVAEAIFFAVFDPFDLHFLGAPLELSRVAIYTMGFFGFWAMGFASAALAAFLNGDLVGRREG